MEKNYQLQDLEERIKQTFNAKSFRYKFEFELEDWGQLDYALTFDGLIYIDDLKLLQEVTGDTYIQVAADYDKRDVLQILMHDFNAKQF